MKRIQIVLLCLMGLSASEMLPTVRKVKKYIEPKPKPQQPSSKKPFVAQREVSYGSFK